MTIPFSKVSKQIYNVLAGANYQVELFDENNNNVYNPADAYKFFTHPDNIMVSLHQEERTPDDSEASKMKVSLSNGVDLAKFENEIGKKLRIIANQSGQNMSYDIRSFGKVLQPKDFAHQVKMDEGIDMDKIIEEGSKLTGTTKSSYQKVGECRVIIRHTDKIDENKFGARSRNIHSIFVETKNGERFRIAENNLAGARAVARHLSNGGSPFDTIGMRINSIMEQMTKLREMAKELRKHQSSANLSEYQNLMNNLRDKNSTLRESLKRISGANGYTQFVAENSQPTELNEDHPMPQYTNKFTEIFSKLENFNKNEIVARAKKSQKYIEMLMAEALDEREKVTEKDIGDLILSKWFSGLHKLENQDFNKINPMEKVLLDLGLHLIGFQGGIQQLIKLDSQPKVESIDNNGDLERKKIAIEKYIRRKIPQSGKIVWLPDNKFKLELPGSPEGKIFSIDKVYQNLGESIKIEKDDDKPEQQPLVTDQPKDRYHVARDNSDKWMSKNYTKVEEMKVLESWFNDVSKVEFYSESDLVVKEDKAPTVEKILPKNAIHTLNMYVGHPLFHSYIKMYEEQGIIDEVINLVETESKLFQLIDESRQLNEFANDHWEKIEQAFAELADDMSDNKKGYQDAITDVARKYTQDDPSQYQFFVNQLARKAENSGLAKHDFDFTLDNDIMNGQSEVRKNKEEIENEMYYGDAKFMNESDDSNVDPQYEASLNAVVEYIKKIGEDKFSYTELHELADEYGVHYNDIMHKLEGPEPKEISEDADYKARLKQAYDEAKQMAFGPEKADIDQILDAVVDKYEIEYQDLVDMLPGEILGKDNYSERDLETELDRNDFENMNIAHFNPEPDEYKAHNFHFDEDLSRIRALSGIKEAGKDKDADPFGGSSFSPFNNEKEVHDQDYAKMKEDLEGIIHDQLNDYISKYNPTSLAVDEQAQLFDDAVGDIVGKFHNSEYPEYQVYDTSSVFPREDIVDMIKQAATQMGWKVSSGGSTDESISRLSALAGLSEAANNVTLVATNIEQEGNQDRVTFKVDGTHEKPFEVSGTNTIMLPNGRVKQGQKFGTTWSKRNQTVVMPEELSNLSTPKTMEDYGNQIEEKQVDNLTQDKLNQLASLSNFDDKKKFAIDLVNSTNTKPENKMRLIRRIQMSRTPGDIDAILWNMKLSGEGLGSVVSNWHKNEPKPMRPKKQDPIN